MIKLIVILIIFAFSALSNYLQKRRQAERQREAARNPPPPMPTARVGQNRPITPRATTRPTGPASWEEELRRLLEGETPSAPPVVRPPPPMAAPPSTPRTMTLPPLRPAAPAPTPMRPAVVRPAIVRVPESDPAPLAVPKVTNVANRDLASMSQSREAYERARQLAQQTAARIEKVPTQRVQLTTVTRAKVSAELGEAVAMFKNPRAARQAVIASLVLGAPRGLDPDAGASAHV